MKLNAPFFKQTTELNCGPAALKMIFSYLGKDTDLKKIEEHVGIKEGKIVSTIRLAIASVDLGFMADFYSKHVSFNEDNLKLDYYKKFGDSVDLVKTKYDRLVKEAEAKGVKIEQRSLTLDEIVSFLPNGVAPLVLLDWSAVVGKGSYQGHFVPVVGFDNKYIYVHNHEFNNPKPYFPIEKKTFEKARKSDGTDEDILIIRK